MICRQSAEISRVETHEIRRESQRVIVVVVCLGPYGWRGIAVDRFLAVCPGCRTSVGTGEQAGRDRTRNRIDATRTTRRTQVSQPLDYPIANPVRSNPTTHDHYIMALFWRILLRQSVRLLDINSPWSIDSIDRPDSMESCWFSGRTNPILLRLFDSYHLLLFFWRVPGRDMSTASTLLRAPAWTVLWRSILLERISGTMRRSERLFRDPRDSELRVSFATVKHRQQRALLSRIVVKDSWRTLAIVVC